MKNNLSLSLKSAKEFLKDKNEEGNSVYEHICELINFMIVEQPEKCYENFEMISDHVKQNRKNCNKILENEKKEKSKNACCLEEYVLNEYIKKKKEWISKIKSTFLTNAKLKPKKMPHLIDIHEEAKLMNWAGYSISNNCIYFINKSTRNILEQYNEHLLSLQFWGIIKGIQRDYYILEGELKSTSDVFNTKKLSRSLDNIYEKEEEEEEEESEENESESGSGSEESTSEEDDSSGDEEDEKTANDEEKKYSPKNRRSSRKRKQMKQKQKCSIFLYRKEDYEFFNKNINRHIYFVSIDGESEWTFLNFIDPETIKVAKNVQKMCTGNLEHMITSYPNIVIKERVYLRALIAIISAETHIAPKNYYTFGKGIDKKRSKSKGSEQETEEEEDQDKDEEKSEDGDKDEDEDEDIISEGNEKENYEAKGRLIKNKNFQFDLNSLSILSNWVYHKYGFLQNGHINYPKDAKIGKNKKNKKMQNIIRENPPLKILRNIMEETDRNAQEWKINHFNAGHYYGNENLHYDIIVIYNMIFYGAFTIYFNKQFVNLYIGTGIRSFNLTVHMYAPGKIQSDQSELSEMEFVEKT